MAMVLNRIFRRFRSPIFGLIKLLAAFHTFWNQQLVFCHRHTAFKRCWHVLDLNGETSYSSNNAEGGGPRVVVSTAAFHVRVRGSVPGLGGLKETKMFLPQPRVKVSIVGSFRDREVACSASDRQGSNFESCVWRTVSSQSSHNPQCTKVA